MLTKYNDIKTFSPGTTYISLLKLFHVRGVFRIFVIREGAPNFAKLLFQAAELILCNESFYWHELILCNLSDKNDSRGVRGHTPPENFCKLTYCNSHFSAF